LVVGSEIVAVDETTVVAQPEHVPVPLAARKAVRWQTSYIRTTVFVDMLCMLVAASLAVNVRFSGPSDRPGAYLAITFLLPPLWGGTLRLCGAYDPKLIGVGSDEFRKVLNAGVCLTAAVAIASYVTNLQLARIYVAIALPTATVLNLFARYWLRKRLHAQRVRGYHMQRVVAVGHPDSVASLISELGRWHSHGLSVVGACLTGDTAFLPTIAGIPVVGGVDETTRAVATLEADTVAVLACPELSGPRMRELAWELEDSGTDVYIAPTVLDIAEARTTIRPIAGLPLLHLEHPQRTGSKLVIKSLLDRAAATIALVLLAPVFVAIAIRIRAADSGPIFFKQVRVGLNGQPFKVWKFRTMVINAERLQANLTEQNEGNGALFKMRKDPRITKPGTWLRRYSLDELPQLINVARGEMSIVGPRPALPEETAKYNGTHMTRRIVVKPGITGLWQVSGRSDLSLADSMRLDVHYVENWSLVLDLQILWKTAWAVFGGDGAY
jgi:exopolysaccharide biosynthesis polyprenyl glycosylphosphotransferase